MAIIRAQHDKQNPYVQVNTKSIARSTKLCLKDRGTLLLMLSMKDDWKFNILDLARRGNVCKDAMSASINRLIQKGYIIRIQKRHKSGKFETVEYKVYESPHPENPDTGKPAVSINNSSLKRRTNKPKRKAVVVSSENEQEKTIASESIRLPEKDAITELKCLPIAKYDENLAASFDRLNYPQIDRGGLNFGSGHPMALQHNINYHTNNTNYYKLLDQFNLTVTQKIILSNSCNYEEMQIRCAAALNYKAKQKSRGFQCDDIRILNAAIRDNWQSPIDKNKAFRDQQDAKEATTFSNRLTFIEMRKKSFQEARQQGIYIDDKINFCQIGDDKIYYDNEKFEFMISHAFLKNNLNVTTK